MEESDLLRERLQAITEKHRIQKDIRQKKLELDQEKLKLQHLKKKALRERWLLQESTSHNATDQQQTRALQLNIHGIEMEVESLEREEAMISTNESFILNRLKAVEKSPGDIIKEAQDSFVPEPLQVFPDVPESLSAPAYEPDPPRKTLFAMEINVTKDLLTGRSSVLSTAVVPPDELIQPAGLKVFDDGRKCVYALKPPEGSHDQSSLSELSANEVEQLLRSATEHRRVHQQNQQVQQNHQIHQNHQIQQNQQNHSRGFHHHQEERDRFDLRTQRGHPRLLRNTVTDWQRKPVAGHHHGYQDSQSRRQEERNNQSNLREGRRYGNQRDGHHGWQPVRKCHSVQDDRLAGRHTGGIARSHSVVNEGRANGCPPPRSHDQKAPPCYTPAHYIPLSDYISVDREEVYGYSRDGDPPSPLYGDDSPYTILHAMDTTEPITAIFMGFQTAQDDSRPGQEFEGCLKAELVVIEDGDDTDHGGTDRKRHVQLSGKSHPSSANEKMGRVEGAGNRAGIRKIQKKQRPCCTVC